MPSTRRLGLSVTLSEAVAAFKEGRVSAHQVLEVFYSDRIVDRVIEFTCRKVGLVDAVDDIKQEIGLLLSQKFLDEIQEPGAIYAVIKQTTKNKCIDLIRKQSVRQEQSLDALIEGVSESGDSSSLKELEDHSQVVTPGKLVELLDQEKAKTMFTLRLQDPFRVSRFDTLLGVPSNLPVLPSPSQSAKKERPKLKTLLPKKSGADADRLTEIRDTLGMQNDDFAALLGLTEPMLCFYLYNSRRKIPESVMDEATSIMGQMNEDRRSAFKYLSTTGIAEIVEGWMVTLDINPTSRSANEDLGVALSLDRSTIWRWRTNKHKPRMSLLMRAHFAVQAIKASKEPQAA